METKQVINHSFHSAWFRQWLGLHYLHRNLTYCITGVNAVKAVCVTWLYRLKFASYGPVDMVDLYIKGSFTTLALL